MANNNYNNDELITPTWIDNEFFKTVLKESKNDIFKEMIAYKITPATAKGDHYGSVMFRAHVLYCDELNHHQQIFLIIKTMPEVDGAKKDLLNKLTIFEVEIEMFRDIIPKFHEMLRSVGDQTKLAANMLYYTLSPRKVIVLEDIAVIGFSTLGQRMCTLVETKMAFDMLAKWYACSYILNEETNGKLEKFTCGMYNLPGTESNIFFTKGSERVLKIAKQTEKLQPYIEILEKIQDRLYKKCIKVYDTCGKKGRINVLAHGDFSMKNLMFHFNSETKLTEKIIFIDFQICVWGSMALDLFSFLYISLDGKEIEKYQDEIIYNFFIEFLNCLKKFQYKGKLPKFIDFQIDMLEISEIEVFLVFTFLPVIIGLIEHPNIDHTEYMTNNNVLFDFYKSKKYIDVLEPALKRFLYKGYFDKLLEN